MCRCACVIMAMAAQRPAVRHFQITLSPLQRLDRGLFIDAEDNRVLRRGQCRDRPRRAALAANSGSLLSHQDLRPAKSIFWARRNRQTYCTSTSPSAAANNRWTMAIASCRAFQQTSWTGSSRPIPEPKAYSRLHQHLDLRGLALRVHSDRPVLAARGRCRCTC